MQRVNEQKGAERQPVGREFVAPEVRLSRCTKASTCCATLGVLVVVVFVKDQASVRCCNAPNNNYSSNSNDNKWLVQPADAQLVVASGRGPRVH